MKLPERATLPGLLHELERLDAERVAIVFQLEDDDHPITYRELVQRAGGFARALKVAGIEAGEPIIIILEHSLDLVFSFFGALLNGSIPAIMPFLTEKLSPDRYRESLASLIEITRPAALVSYRGFESEIDLLPIPGSSVRTVIYVDDQRQDPEWIWDEVGELERDPEGLALLQHSSGTTGLQKGVALSHQAVINQLRSYADALELTPDDVIVSWLPLYHDMGLIAGFILPILTGVKLILMSPFDWVRAPYRLMHSVSKFSGTLTWLPNFAFNFCTRKIRDRDLEGVQLSSWRAVINCSEPMRYESHEMFLERFRPFGLQSLALATCYAMAENVFAVTQGGIGEPVLVDEVSRQALSTQGEARPAEEGEPFLRMLSAGAPISNTHIRIIDAEGNSLPDRVIGEIALKGDCLLSEYYRRPDLTLEAFNDGWYKTGDLGYLHDGQLFITGRAKDLIIVGGKNIYPQDLEALVHEVPGVYPGRAVAFGVDNPSLGTEDVVVVAERDETVDAQVSEITQDIRLAVAHGSDVTARYAQVVERGWLIKTSSGKNARRANKEKYLHEFGS
jgi:acyl-CoA synthetase (AMP-forming)/AMP-acid ligase II